MPTTKPEKNLLGTIAVLRNYLEMYQIPNREFIAVKVCLECLTKVFCSFDKTLPRPVITLMGFSVYIVKSGECISCQD